ncbi:MAG: hypothetical protein ACOYNI_10875 [Acidimicrobiia bacterium]
MEGEILTVSERMIVAPTAGTFRADIDLTGADVECGDTIGHVEGPGSSTPVRSPFAGTLMGVLAHEGERLRVGEGVAWLRTS